MTAQRQPYARAASHFVSALAILLAGAAILLMPSRGSAATVVGSIQDISYNPYGGTVNQMQFTPLSCPQQIGTNTVWPVQSKIRLTNGLFQIQLAGGLYYAGLVGDAAVGQTPKTVKILVPPNDTNVWQFNACALLATNLSFIASNSIYDFVFHPDTNAFTVTNSTLYSKGVIGSGSFASLVTNIVSTITNFPYATNADNRIFIGPVPSYFSASLLGGNPSRCANPTVGTNGVASPPFAPFFIQMSTDGGTTWVNASKTTAPVLISLWCFSGYPAYYTNLTVRSFSNPSVIGTTNDLTSQTLLVAAPTQPLGAANLQTAQTVAAAAMTNWAYAPANSAVNLVGNPVTLNSQWTVISSNRSLIFRGAEADVFTLTAGIFGGTGPVLNNITLTGTNVLFQLTSAEAPTIQFNPVVSDTGWADLPGQTNWFDNAAGFWYVAGGTANAASLYFRASVATTNSVPASVSFSGVVNGVFAGDGSGLTNLNVSGGGGGLTNNESGVFFTSPFTLDSHTGPNGGLYYNAGNLNVYGSITSQSGNFTGNGSGLTNIPITAIVGGASTNYVNTATNQLISTNLTVNTYNGLTNSVTWSGNQATINIGETTEASSGISNLLASPLTITGTNVVINLAGYSNSVAQCAFYVQATTNLFFDLVTNAPPGFQFSVEVSQAGQFALTFNTNYSATAAAWVPPAFGQILTLPTNTTLCRQIISAQIGRTGTNCFFNQLNFVR